MTYRDLLDLAQTLAPEIEDCGATLAMASNIDDVVNGCWQLRSLLCRLERAVEPYLLPRLEPGEPDSEMMQ